MDPATTLECYVVTAPGVEAIAASECQRLGIVVETIEPGALKIITGFAGLLRANLMLRTASRILVHLGSFHARTFYQLERRLTNLPWDAYLPAGGSVDVRVTSRASALYHQRAIAERVHRVLGDAFTAPCADRIEQEGRRTVVVVRMLRDRCHVRVDSSGAHLHQRGYRLDGGRAPVRETLAAALIQATGWDGTSPILDPLCGSGTLLIEAAMIATGTAPGLQRSFACERWPGVDPVVVRRVRADVVGATGATPVRFLGGDRDSAALEAAKRNAARAGMGDLIEFRHCALSDWTKQEVDPRPAWIVTNPPYGARLVRSGGHRGLYRALGRLTRGAAPEPSLALLCPMTATDASRALGITVHSMFLTTNGGIRVRGLVQEGIGERRAQGRTPGARGGGLRQAARGQTRSKPE